MALAASRGQRLLLRVRKRPSLWATSSISSVLEMESESLFFRTHVCIALFCFGHVCVLRPRELFFCVKCPQLLRAEHVKDLITMCRKKM